MHGFSPNPVIFQIRLGRFAPKQIAEWRHGQSSGGCHVTPARNRIKTFGRPGQVPIPEDFDTHGLGPLTGFAIGHRGGKFPPAFDGHGKLALTTKPRFHGLSDGLTVGLQTCLLRPRLADHSQDMVEGFFRDLFGCYFARCELLTRISPAIPLTTGLLPKFF